jgi:hypothetical protein
VEFHNFGKITRLSKEIVVTEKIDGTNAQVFIRQLPGHEEMPTDTPIVAVVGDLLIYAGSRTRWIVPGDDNFGFAAWAKDNSEELSKLGIGHHFGEWWGKGIQRGYGLDEKKFSLFNSSRWEAKSTPKCCSIVPTLYRGSFDTDNIRITLDDLKRSGSAAAPGFMNPEGIVIYHTAANILFKKTFDGDNHKICI